MTAPVRFFFDECMSRPVVQQNLTFSLKLLDGGIEIAHLFDKFARATPDSVWIPALADEGGWIVVTSDRGVYSRTEESLPRICKMLGVSHVLLSSALHHRSAYEKAVAIESRWRELIAIGDEPPGVGYRLSMTSKLTSVLTRIFVPEPPPHPDQRQRTLFDENSADR